MAIPVLIAGAMQLYKGYQIAKFAKVAYSTLRENDLSNGHQTKMSKFLNIGKAALGVADAMALKGAGGAFVKGLGLVATADTGISVMSKIGELKSGSLMDKLGALKKIVDTTKVAEHKPR